MLSFSKSLPDVRKIVLRKQKLFKNHPNIARVLSGKTFISFRRQQNLKDLLVHRKHNTRLYKEKHGTFQCGRKCTMCKYLKEGSQFSNNGKTSSFATKGLITCTSVNLVYGVYCKRCRRVMYVGETMTTLYQRHQQNLSRIRTGSQ